MSRKQSFLIFIILFICYSYILPRWSDWNQNSRLNLTMALAEQGSVIIDDYLILPESEPHGIQIGKQRMNTGDVALYQGHFYSDKAPGPAFLALPIAQIVLPTLASDPIQTLLNRIAQSPALSATLNSEGGGINQRKLKMFVLQISLSIVVAAFVSAVSAIILIALLKQLGISAAGQYLTVLGYGLASLLMPYASNFYSHTIVAALLLGALFIAIQSYHPRRAILLGLLLGWAAISEYPTVLAGGIIGLLAMWQWRTLGAWLGAILGGCIPITLMLVYNYQAFGTLQPIGYEYSVLWQNQHQTGFMSLTYPRLAAIWGLLFGQYRGLFFRAPWLILALPSLWLWWRSELHRTLWWACTLSILSTVLFYASSVMWWGGFTAGPRYLVPIVPFLALAAAWGIDWLWQRNYGRSIVVSLLLISFVLTWAETLATQMFPSDQLQNPWFEQTLPAWSSGNIARNLGMALGLQGILSLVPLLVIMCGLLILIRPNAQQSLAHKG